LLLTMASGSRSARRRCSAGGKGAEPMATISRLERSAASKRSWVTSSWAIAGTRKAMVGRRASTVSIHRSTSKRGRYTQDMPIFIGL
jgi:hypothetical protein